eukprot:TRINITY_DN369_c0_g1_i1.p1 TRINITY_DN369_c0_g1~~TRINITY_DN369_c0_g1_i1.p1  ORF type:complete len:245 (-),score=55.68 TRINITY_DN369_c0_g1_i1:26-673(-)
MDSQLTFYFAPYCTASVTQAVLAQLHTPHTLVTLDLSKGDTRKPEFLAINPNGRVPTIVHGETVIWESAAITMYLGETFGVDAKLYPAAGPARGEAMKWIVWTNMVLASAGGRLAAHKSGEGSGGTQETSPGYIAPDKRNAEAAEQAKADINASLGILDNHLSGKQYMLGSEYSLVDTHLHSFVAWVQMMGTDTTPHTHVHAWFKRCSDRTTSSQ